MESLPSGKRSLEARLEKMVLWNFEVVILDSKEWASRPENKGKGPKDASLGDAGPPTGRLVVDKIPVLPPGANSRTKLKIAINLALVDADIREVPKGVTADTLTMNIFVHELTHYVLGKLPKEDEHPDRPENDRRFWISTWSARYAQFWRELFGVEHYMKEFSRNKSSYTLPPCTPGGTFVRKLDLFGFDSLETQRNFGGIFP